MKFLIICYFLTWLMIPWILWANKRPISTLAWIWAIMLFPFLGPVAYLLFGVDRISNPHRSLRDEFKEGMADAGEIKTTPEEAPLFRALEKLSGFAPTTANRVDVLDDGPAFYASLEDAIERAKHHVHLIFFIWEADEYGQQFLDRLIAAARRGVKVRLLLDRMGSQNTKEEFFKPLSDAGGKFAWFRTINPLRRHFSLHLRNHRKLQIIDGLEAFVGGMNIGKANLGQNPDLGKWNDMQVKVAGNVVSSLQAVFAQDWLFASEERIDGPDYFRQQSESGEYLGQVIVGGPDFEYDAMAESHLALLSHATKRAWIATGYFAPDERLLSAIRLAALRGADVRLLVSQKSDHPYLVSIGQSYYETLMEAGVRIFELKEGINHSKIVLMDDDYALIGSANCDDRSMRLNFELSVLIRCPKAARDLERTFDNDFNGSDEILLEAFRKRPLKRRILEAVFRPISPMT